MLGLGPWGGERSSDTAATQLNAAKLGLTFLCNPDVSKLYQVAKNVIPCAGKYSLQGSSTRASNGCFYIPTIIIRFLPWKSNG